MDNLTQKKLSEIEARLSKATPGPWENDAYAGPDGPYLCKVVSRDPSGKPTNWIIIGRFDYGSDKKAPANKAFIANAPTDVQSLLAAVRVLTARLWETATDATQKGFKIDDLEADVRVRDARIEELEAALSARILNSCSDRGSGEIQSAVYRVRDQEALTDKDRALLGLNPRPGCPVSVIEKALNVDGKGEG